MAESLGTIKGQMILDVKQALASYTSARQAHVATVTALRTGGAALAATGAAIAGVGAAMAGGLLYAIDAASQFEKKLDYFTAVAGPDAIKNYDAIKAKALQLGADTIYSANQIADSFVELGKAGVSAQQILDGVGKGVAALGAAADIPLDTAANIITAAVQTFGLSADKAVDVANKLAGAANSSIVDVQDLGVSLKYAGGVAATLGVPFTDLNTALAILGTRGIKGSTAGTSLRQTLTSLTGSTDNAKDALKALGIITEDGSNKFFDMAGNLKPLPEVFQTLNDALSGYSSEQQIAAIKTIFSQRAITTVTTLAHAGAKGFDDMAASIDKITAADVASKRLDNLAGDIEILKGNLDTLFISAGGGFQNFARGIVQGVTSLIDVFTSMPQWAQTTVFAVIAAFGGLLIIVGTLGILAGGILNLIALGQVLGPVFAGLSVAVRSVASAFAAMNVTLAQNPFVRIIAIIGLLVTAFIILFNTNQQFHDAVQPLFTSLIAIFVSLGPIINNVLGTIGQFLAALTGNAVSAGTGFVGMLAQLASTLGGTLAGAIQTILPPFISFVQMIVGLLMPAIQAVLPMITTLGQIFAAVFSGNLEALPALIGTIMGQFGALISTVATQLIPAIIQILTNVIVALIGMLPALVQGAVTLFTGLVTAAATILPQLITAVLGLVLQLVTTLVSLLPTLIQAAVTLFTGLVQGILTMLPVIIQAGITLFTGLIQAVVTIIPLLINTIVTLIPIIITTLVGALPLLITAALSLFLGLLTGLLTALPQIITALVEAIPQIITALVDAVPLIIDGAITMFLGILTALITAIPQILLALINAIPLIVTALVNAIPQIIEGALKLFIGIVTGLIKAIPQIIAALIGMIPQLVGALIGAVPKLIDAGVQLISGLINGIGSMAGKLWDAATRIAGQAIDAIKSFFGIKSPSKVMAGIGVFLIQGLVNGVTGMQARLVKTMTDTAAMVAAVPFGLSNLTDSMSVTKQLAIGSGTLAVQSEASVAIAGLSDALQKIADKDTVNVEKVEINNPEPEPASDSLPSTIRKMADV